MSSNTRSPSEIEILKAEAERRMRLGDRRADIARDLGVPPSTLGKWASDGLWRRKDLAFELDEERGRATLARIAAAAAAEVEATRERAERVLELGKAAAAAIQAADPDGERHPPGTAPIPTHQLSMQMAHNLIKEGRIDEADRAARFALRFAKAQQVTRDREADQWRQERERFREWWKEYRGGFEAFHKYANELADEVELRRKLDQEAYDAEYCTACCRPMEFWPAEMDRKIERRQYEREMKDG